MEPSRSFTARGALSARFMVVKLRYPRYDLDEVGILVHYDHTGRADGGAGHLHRVGVHADTLKLVPSQDRRR